MTKDCLPKEEHQPVSARTIEFISDELAELQQAINCPNSFIIESAKKVVSIYQTKQTNIKRDNE